MGIRQAPPPFWQEVLLDGHTADACSDPTATFDHLGNAYIGGVFFDINSPANAVMVAKANTGIKGRFYHTPTPGQFQEYSTTPMGKPANDNNPDIFHDKEFIVADSRPSSAKRGNGGPTPPGRGSVRPTVRLSSVNRSTAV